MGKYTVLVNENMGEVSWEMVKKADIHGVMLCAGYGGEVDRFFRANADCCEKLGIPFGVYWTSYAVTGRDAEAEKRELKGMIEGYQILKNFHLWILKNYCYAVIVKRIQLLDSSS